MNRTKIRIGAICSHGDDCSFKTKSHSNEYDTIICDGLHFFELFRPSRCEEYTWTFRTCRPLMYIGE